MTAQPRPAPAEPNTPGPGLEITWDQIAASAPQLAVTMRRYLDQLAVSLRPNSVADADTTLRIFAGFLTGHDPHLATVADIGRSHVEAYKAWLATRAGRGGKPLSANTIRQRLGTLRIFFERILEWGYPDAPARVPIFAGDLPRIDEPLPRFLDDASATKLMRAASAEPDRLRRLVVELLARTGLRVGELCALQTDAVVRIGDTHWLRVPLGKLHNDRYIPLHPQLVELIADYLAARAPGQHRTVADQGRASAGSPYGHPHPWPRGHRCRHRPRSSPPAATHFGYPGNQPGHVARGDRGAARAPLDAHDHGLRPHRRGTPWPTNTSRSPARSRHSTTSPKRCPPTLRGPKCAACVPKPTGGCSATVTAPAPSSWTAPLSRSARPARTSRPPSSPPQLATPTRRRRGQEPNRPSTAVREPPRPPRWGGFVMPTPPLPSQPVTVTGVSSQLTCAWCHQSFTAPARRGPAPSYCRRSASPTRLRSPPPGRYRQGRRLQPRHRDKSRPAYPARSGLPRLPCPTGPGGDGCAGLAAPRQPNPRSAHRVAAHAFRRTR